MRDRLFSLLGVEPGEESLVSMLLTQSVFLGIFFGAFDISAHSLFLSIFDEKMMARGYVVSGLAGIVLTSIYTWLQTRLNFRNFAIINLIAVTAMTLLLWTGLLLSHEKWIIFLVFIMLGPLNILAALGFWGTTGRLFTLRQGKRLFGLVDSGLVVGIILSCYTIPVLLAIRFEPRNILLISGLSLFVAAILQMVIGSKFRFSTGGSQKTESKEKKSVFSILSGDRYTRIIALFVVLSVMTAFFVQYSFMAVTREQYLTEEDMARFLGIFTGSMMIFTLMIKLFVFSYLIRNYGLRTCLVISPVLMAVFTAIAILIGITMGYTPESASGFTIFFLLMAVSRLFSKSFKDSIESPSFKVIYQTIDERRRFEVQSGMDGTVNEISALSSGLLLAGLGILSFVRLIHFPVVLFIIIISWISVAFVLYSEYRKSIRKALEETVGSRMPEGIQVAEYSKHYSTAIRFRNEYYRLITGDYSSLDTAGRLYFEKIAEYSNTSKDINLSGALKEISSKENVDSDLRAMCTDIVVSLSQPGPTVKQDKAIYARQMLSESRVPNTTEILRLLRDSSVESRRFGIYMIGKFRLKDMLPEACECLNNPSLETDASTVISTFGPEAVTELIRFFMMYSGNVNTGMAVLRLLGKIGSPECHEFLFARLWANSREIRETAVKQLENSGFRPTDEEKDRLHQLISETIGYIAWNISAKVCLTRNNNTFLLEKINRETTRWKAFFFSLLSITYDQGSINKIKENLEKDTAESGNFALEMIDIVIDDTIKPKVIALLDTVPDEDKLKNLFNFYPGEIPSYSKLMEDILNRDYNLLTVWTKACTLHSISEITTDSLAESASALLFSPEEMLREEAARLLARTGMQAYKNISGRIPESLRHHLNLVTGSSFDDKELNFQKNMFLAHCLKEIPEEELVSLSRSMIYTGKGEDVSAAYDCLVWSLDGNEGSECVSVMWEKTNGIQSSIMKGMKACYLLPLASVEEFRSNNPERSQALLNYIDNHEE